MKDTDIILLVGSLDRYSGAWPPFCHGMRKYWPDCPYPIYFVTNELTAPCGTTIKVGGDRVFSDNTLNALAHIDATTVLWMLDEYWLYEQPDTQAIMEFGEIVARGEADHIRLISGWVKNIYRKGSFIPDPRLCTFTDNSAYRVTAQAAFWNVAVLKDILKPGESVWEFENIGTERSRKYGDRFLCIAEHKYMHYIMPTKDPTYKSPYTSSAVTKGVWGIAAKKYAEEEELDIDFSQNPRDFWRACDGKKKEVLSNYDARYYRERKTERRPYSIIPALTQCLIDNLGPFRSAIDLGAGAGYYAATLAGAGVDTWAVDISRDAPVFDCKGVHSMRYDLQDELKLNRTFDLVLCIEVAEHLPESAADELCATIARHTHRKVVFTAAPPGQGGTGHINCQPPDYWREKLERCGLRYLPRYTEIIKQKWAVICGGKFAYLSRNVSVYKRRK